MPSKRQRKLDSVVAGLQMRFGTQAIHRAASVEPVPHISTTFAELDAALAIGGLPRGRVSEIIGPPSSGKVTLAAKVLAAAHRERSALVAWLDLARTCDPDYLHRCGLDLDRLLVVHPAQAADALAITLHLVESNTLAALVFDGLAGLLGPTRPGEPDLEPVLLGTLERLATAVARTETVVIFLTEPQAQYRTLAHLAAVRLEIRRERWIRHRSDVRGYEGHVNVLKHKLGPAGATVVIRVAFNGTVRSQGLL